MKATARLALGALCAASLAACGGSSLHHASAPVRVMAEPTPAPQMADPWYGIPADCRGLDPSGHKVAVTCR